MYKIEENGQVMKQEKGETYEIWSHFGMIKQCNLINETSTEKIFQWQIFDLEQGKYVDDLENNTPFVFEGVEYIPVNGKIIVSISANE